MTGPPIEVLVRFARRASEAGLGEAILPLLADALAEQVHADAVAIIEIRKGGARIVPSARLPEEVVGFELDPDAVGAELPDALLAACKGRFENAVARPLVSGGGLFGSVLMLFHRAAAADELGLADGLIDIAAVALETAARLQQIAAQHATLRAQEEALAKGEKLRALGQMASGVSHDLKNILNPLSGYLQLVDRALDRGNTGQAKDLVGKMKQSLVRGVQTVDLLRDYGRQSPESEPEEIDLNQLVHEALEIAKPRMSGAHRRQCVVAVDLGSPSVTMGRAGEIVSALVNLMVNAIDAMASGGTLTVRTGSDQGASWVVVADTGPGMPPEIEARVFEPFFTTKGDEGTGLGLAMVYACMQRHGGSVRLETAVGKGTQFTLSFPVAPARR